MVAFVAGNTWKVWYCDQIREIIQHMGPGYLIS